MRAVQLHPGALTVLFWFLGTALVSTWFVFRDARMPRWWILVGAIAPDVVDGIGFCGAAVAHSIVVGVGVLVVVMLTTIGRRQTRKKLLGFSIGWFFHLVFDGAWGSAALFWWPVGRAHLGRSPLPSFGRPWWLTAVMEVAGFLMVRYTYELLDGGPPRPESQVPTC